MFVGTAGWSIARRYATDFPGEGSHLQRYAARLDAVEINSSFYRPHRRDTYLRWADSVPPHFRFSVKLPKAITHEHRLEGCQELLDAFFDQVEGLGGKLGVVLVQLPPSLGFEEVLVAAFLREIADRTEARIALEPRHASWFTGGVDALLSDHGVARVAADPPPAPAAAEPGGSQGLVYRRLHGSPRIYRSDYDPARLQGIAAQLTKAAPPAGEIWCIFDNTAEGHALANALALNEAFAAEPLA